MGGPGGAPPFAGGHHGGFNAGGMPGAGGRQIYVSNVCSILSSIRPLMKCAR